MRLKKLFIESYKNIQGEYSFEENQGYIALIGLNGSGKSNLLEAISLVFDVLYGIKESAPIGNFWIEYELDGEVCFYGTVDKSFNSIELDKHPKLPSSLISCYSGEDNRLWNFCYKDYYVRFFNAAVGGGEYKPKSLYVNKYCWKIAFISLLFSENEEVKSFIRDILKIDTQDVTVRFVRRAGNNITNHDASNWLTRIEEKYSDDAIPVEELKYEDLMCNVYPDLTPDSQIFYYLYFLHMPEKNAKVGMRADKLIENIDIHVNGYDFNDLSEGEKKLILIECITKILGDKDSLVLLDEPDAHTHIALKKELLKAISDFEGQTIMTTHSPMFLNKRWEGYHKECIFYMHDGQVEKADGLAHLSDLTDGAIDYFEGSFILSSKKILVVEGKYDDKYLKKAISVLKKQDDKYSKLNQITIMSSNGASEAVEIYNQILAPCETRIDQIVFLFDYDDGGWKDGWKKINAVSDGNSKILPMFYQDDYESASYPTSTEGVKRDNGKESIKSENSYMVEDLFAPKAYEDIVIPVINSRSHKEFRSLTIGKKGTAGAIKKHIEDEYNNFMDEWFNGFKPVLDKLLEVFNL